ncbi:MAG TPA: hypothetical protein VFB14_22015 [Bryobacteraceae bacterium]|nr:hypothetical protein [Bryobacteraceae bacterium]
MRKERNLGLSGIVAKVRSAIAARDLSAAEQLVHNYRHDNGITSEALEALSWLARGSLAARRFAKAANYARNIHRSAVRRLDGLELDAEPSLSSALGASIEVLAQLKEWQGRRSEAVRFLKRELAEYGSSSIGTRIRKNLNLLTLEGQPAPELEIREWLGPKPAAVSKLHGQPVLLFFWAHYCEDSRAQGRVLTRVLKTFGSESVVVIGPTRRYGYLDEHRHKPASHRQETAHIQAVLKRYYSSLSGMPVPVGERNFDIYGASTTPTLVLLDGAGMVSLYHPGKMPFQEVAFQIRRVLT